MQLNIPYLNYVFATTITTFILLITVRFSYAATPDSLAPSCSIDDVERLEQEFQVMIQRHTQNPNLYSKEEIKVAALNYILASEQCYQAASPHQAQVNDTLTHIDEGGVWALGFDPAENGISAEYSSYGTKWGAGSPFSGGQDVASPTIPGGIVTYSFMGNGVSHSVEGKGGNSHINSLNGYSSCFLTEISNAFAAWSAVADIQFVQTSDNGVPSNYFGATGDIRIGAHSFDGAGGTLAHAYYPPPNGASISGDIHFDVAENWSCTNSGGFDIGIVALHEIGHSIGLKHESIDLAVMNPFYNSTLSGLLQDDIDGATLIYGSVLPSLGVTISSNPGVIISGTTTIDFTLAVVNSNDASATNVIITNTIPANTVYVASSVSHSGVEVSPGVLEWPATTVAGNSIVYRTFRVNVNSGLPKGTTLFNVVSLTSAQGVGDSNQQFLKIYDPYLKYFPIIFKNK